MKILQFAFDAKSDSDYQPHNYNHNCVVYTGTHDNDTSRGWIENTDPGVREYALRYLGVKDRAAAVEAMIRTAMMSVADTCIIPLQDYLYLGSEARINTPSTLGDNWKWRVRSDVFTKELSAKILGYTQIYAR